MPSFPLRITGSEVLAVYDDDLAYLIERIPGATIQRAGRVEPDNEHRCGGNWSVDLSPLGGSVHYTTREGVPFVTRKQALAFEVAEVKKMLGL